jgi:hypothetical protein
MQLILDYPLWFLLFCLLLGAGAAFLLYFKTKHFTDESPSFRYFKWAMAAFRFLSVSIIAFLLLSPFIKSRFIDKIEPIVVLVHDNSLSVSYTFNKIDSAAYFNDLQSLKNVVKEKFQLDFYTFDGSLKEGDSLTFTGKTTNISGVLDELNGIYHNRNVGAVIIATDGIYNEGINPAYSDFAFPVFAIALGDTAPQRDLKVSAVRNNKIAYLNDLVNVEIDMEASMLKGRKFKMEVYRLSGSARNKIAEKDFSVSKDYEEFQTAVQVKAESAGMLRFRVELSRLDDEITFDNNERDFYVEVIDSRQKILIVANAPHPDIGAIRQVVDLNKNFELSVQYVQEFNAVVENYNLVILHQLPSQNIRANQVFSAVKKARVPYWIIAGAASSFEALNQEQNMLAIRQSGSSVNDAGVFFNTSFTLFTVDENAVQKIRRFPPVMVPFGAYELKPGASVLLYQKIGSVETDFPVLVFADNLGVKSGLFVGDGLWRWRMYDYLDNRNHNIFNELVQKTINYLAVKADKRKFKVNLPKNMFVEGEPVILEAELYNDSYELINEPEVALLLKNQDGTEYPFSFGKVNNAYVFRTQSLPVGDYTYIASTSLGGKNHVAEGAFSVQAIQIEALQTRANHQLLYKLAEKTDGALFYPDNLSELADSVLNLKHLKPMLYENFKTRSVLNLFWILILILGFLSAEWFARKYFGGY